MMAKLYTQDELAARDQALVAKACRFIQSKRDVMGQYDGNTERELALELWHAMGYEGALNAFELEEN